MTHEPTCCDCDCDLSRPLNKNANYVRCDRYCETEPQEVLYAMVHTDETLARLDELDALLEHRHRDALNAEMAHPEASETIEVPDGTVKEEREGGWVETAATKEVPFSIPTEEFTHVEVDDPELVKKRDDVALVYKKVEEREVPKTALLCEHCTCDGDEIIWGPDA